MPNDQKRELILPPGTYAYILDGTKGAVRTYVGPIVVNQTGQDRPVRYNEQTHSFYEVDLEHASTKSIVAPEGFYVVLMNPAKDEKGKDAHPMDGRENATEGLLIGQKENIPGPCNFALYPGQQAKVVRGHHLRSNEYLLIKVYNETKARDNWSKAVIQTVGEGEETVVAGNAPEDLAVGMLYNVLGTEVSFYIPPTGVSVIPEEIEGQTEPEFVRAAETLEQLEYAVLVDEDGNKEYPRGPRVVFPKPTQRFISYDGARKFKAIEMNELQGIQLKFMMDGELELANGTKRRYSAGEELFVTGKDMPIYFPQEGHQIVRYDGKTIHYAVAIPDGEARYLMDRKSSEIKTVRGPSMLLPDPVNAIIVRRALSDQESRDWFPGPSGTGSDEALAYNAWLRKQAGLEPTTRSGVVSEGRLVEQGGGGFSGMDAIAAAYNAADVSFTGTTSLLGGSGARRTRGASSRLAMDESHQGKPQTSMGDSAERKSTFNEPRTITFATRYRGVPTLKVFPGYAISVMDADGRRTVHEGPKTVLLDYAQTLDVLKLSTGKPKTTDKLQRTVYLNIKSNKVSDVLLVETMDHVNVELKLSYEVDFEGDNARWFMVENYVKHMCDHIRSILKGAVKRMRIEAFYANPVDTIRDTILGKRTAENAARPGLVFPVNGMHVIDVEIFVVEIKDPKIGTALQQAQYEVVSENLQRSKADRTLALTQHLQLVERKLQDERQSTKSHEVELAMDQLDVELKLLLRRHALALQDRAEEALVEEHEERLRIGTAAAQLERRRSTHAQEEIEANDQHQRALAQLTAETQAIAAKLAAVTPGLIEALQTATRNDMIARFADVAAPHVLLGGTSVVDFISRIFKDMPAAEALVQSVRGMLPNGKQLEDQRD